MLRNLVLVGLGDLAEKTIPAIFELVSEYPSLKITLIDTSRKGDLEKINQLIHSCKIDEKRFDDSFLLDDNNKNKEEFLNKLKERLKGASKTAFYLAISPTAYLAAIRQYGQYSDVFFIEKPWSSTPAAFQELVKATNKPILGVDHYSWRPEVREFLQEILPAEKKKILDTSDNIDIVYCSPNLDRIQDDYYQKTGEVTDMIPHVLPLVHNIFGEFEITEIQVACYICNDHHSIKELVDSAKDVQETYGEIMMKIKVKPEEEQDKLAPLTKNMHVILARGIGKRPVSVCKETIHAEKFLYAAQGRVFLDLTKGQERIVIDCSDKKYLKSDENKAYYNLFKSIIKGEYTKFLDIKTVERFVSMQKNISLQIDYWIRTNVDPSYTEEIPRAKSLLQNKQYWYKRNVMPIINFPHRDCVLIDSQIRP
jgi:glucose-6-phosphate 1-dehydrogenase